MEHLADGFLAMFGNAITLTAAREHYVTIKFAVIFLSVILFIYRLFVHPYLLFKRCGIPYATPIISPIGNLIQISKGLHEFNMKCMKELGNIYGVYIGRRPILCIADPNVLEEVFVKQFANFRHRPSFMGGNKHPMQLGLIMSRYKDWRRVRLTVNPTFTAGKMRQMFPLVEEATDTLVSVLSEISKKKKSTNLVEVFGRMAMDIIFSVAFGIKTDLQLKDNKKLRDECAVWIVEGPTRFIVDMLPLPEAIQVPVRRYFEPDPAYLINLLRPVIEERKITPSNRKDFLQLMLSEKTDGKQKLSDDDIYATAITFLLAGYETTSNTLSFTTYLLALHPDVQERLHQEIDEEFDENSASPYDEVLKLGYLDQVLSESLRMYPPIFHTARELEDDCLIGGHYVPKHVTINIPIYAIHHCEEFWTNHDQFDPERFNAENRPHINPFSYLPFGYGPRNCIGMRFALVETKFTLVKMLKNFKFVRNDETEVPLKVSLGVTMTPANGIKVDMIPR